MLGIKLLTAALLASASTFGALTASAQSGGLKPAVDAIVQPVVQHKQVPALTVAISEGGWRSYITYTGTDEGPLAADSIVEVGSITKVLTTTLFAEALVQGQMAAEGSIQQWMPQGIELPWAARQITPVQLASYQSGMPRLPSDVPQGGIESRDIDHYTTADFLNWMAHWTPERELPAPYLYSNASIGLLALLIGQAMGGQWFDLMQSRIIRPLGMRDTMLQPSPAQAARLAQGHPEDGTPVPAWPLFAWSAASSLKSTAEDMLAFGEANLGHRVVNGAPPPPSLTTAMQIARQPIHAPEGQDFLQAMGWAVFPAHPADVPDQIIAKSGNTDGFSTVLVFAPAKDLAVFVAANQAKVDVQPLGLDIVRHVLPGDAPQFGIEDIPAAALPR